jgi:hypothetical protein
MTADSTVAVFVEAGARRVFASALDWPGWARSGKSEDLALAALADYLPRYAPIAALAGLTPPSGQLVITERHAGLAKNADFGALGEAAPNDNRPLPGTDGTRLTALLAAVWTAFDEVAAAAPPQLRKGPRGGGRDTAQIIEHVRGAEVMYARKLGLARDKAGPRTGRADAPGGPDGDAGPDPVVALRQRIVAALADPPSLVTPATGWLPRTAVRRLAWHVLDHLWEIEDKSDPA